MAICISPFLDTSHQVKYLLIQKQGLYAMGMSEDWVAAIVYNLTVQEAVIYWY